MDLADETTVRGILIAINTALTYAVVKLWNNNQADKKAFKELAEEYIATMKEIITSKIRE